MNEDAKLSIEKLHKLNDAIQLMKSEMEAEAANLTITKEVVLRNFVYGKIAAYNEIMEMNSALIVVLTKNL